MGQFICGWSPNRRGRRASPARLLEAFQQRHASPAAEPPQLPAARRGSAPRAAAGIARPKNAPAWASPLPPWNPLGSLWRFPLRALAGRPVVPTACALLAATPNYRAAKPASPGTTAGCGSVRRLPRISRFFLPLGYQVLPRLARRRHLSSRHQRLRHRRLQLRSRYIRPSQNTCLQLRRAATNHIVLLPRWGGCG